MGRQAPRLAQEAVTGDLPAFHYDGVLVRSNSRLVAPLQLGAGSAIAESVPADALAVGRSRQVVKEEWAAKRRALRKKQQRAIYAAFQTTMA